MFHLQSLELVHWDYCQRVSLPLDASIITIAGPNGSGKTTLLDAMRTLLGLRCSHPRDFKTYARHAGAQTAWLRAVVDNRPLNRQSSSRPFARRLLYSDQVTLACRIERNGGDWQRRYLVQEGDLSIEQLSAMADKDLGLMGIEAWNRLLASAGLSPAICKVLSLEQGQTDRLCEFSPKELLRLVFDVFGDQDVLDAYDTAREHQQQLAREMGQAEHELDHSRAQLAELQNRVSNYQSWQHKVQERERLASEVLPVLEWHGARRRLAERARELRRQRQQLGSTQTERTQQHGRLLDLLKERSRAQDDEARLLAERDEANRLREQARDLEAPLEALVKREAELLALITDETDTTALHTRLAELEAELQGLQEQSARLREREAQARSSLAGLQDRQAPPPPEEARKLRQRLQQAGIAHQFLADVVEVRHEPWRHAIEGVLRPNRWIVLLEDGADELAAYELAERERYRHYIVAPAECQRPSGQAPAHSLLAQLHFSAPVPRWLLQQLERLRCVDSPKAGRQSGEAWITPQAYVYDGRGARSVFVEPRDHQFGTAALQSRQASAEQELQRVQAQLGELGAALAATKRLRSDVQQSLAGHSAAEELARRSEEFAQARASLPAAKQQRIGQGLRWQTLDKAYAAARTTLVQAENAYNALGVSLRRGVEDGERLRQELDQRCRSLRLDSAASRQRRSAFAPGWTRPEAVSRLVDTYQNDTQARLRLASVEEDLQQEGWEHDATVQERYQRMELTVREQGYNLDDHQVKNAQAATAVHNARESYIEVLRATVRRYRNNIRELGLLAGVDVAAELPVLENHDSVLAQAGLKVHFSFDGKGSIGLNDGEASGGQQVIKSLILLVGLLKDDETPGGFVFIDEPFAHLDVRNIQLVGHFLRSTQAQYVLTTPITHNLEVFEPSEITLVTGKKPKDSKWAPPIAVAKRRAPAEVV